MSPEKKTPCEYLRLHLTLSELRNLCDVLEVDYKDHNTASELCTKLKEDRPDLMRGRTWNILRASLRNFDLTTEGGMYALKAWLFPIAYNVAEVGSYLVGNHKNAVGYARHAHQRSKARTLMGKDTRSWFGWNKHMLNSPSKSSRKSGRTARR